MAADRVARGRAGADAVLAGDPARGDRVRRSGRLGSAALADRAGLPGSQAGSRARALRGPRLARLPPSRHAVHRGLWLSDRRAGEIFPLRPKSRRGGAADPTRTARAELDRHRAKTAHRGAGPEPASMPVLRTHKSEQSQPTRLLSPLVTQ